MSEPAHKNTVRAVERALDILLCFTQASSLGMTEIATRVGLHKSTVHRLLASLEHKGFVIRDPSTEKYRLGFRIWELSAQLTQSDDPAVILLPEMERLRDQVGETVSLYVRDGIERIRIQTVQSNQAIRRVAPIGARHPLFVGASSKVLIAYLDASEREHIMQALPWPEELDREAFSRQLDEIQQQGYATSVEEREVGAAAVAAPLFSRTGKLYAALSLSGPSSRFTEDVVPQYAEYVMEAAKRMSKMI